MNMRSNLVKLNSLVKLVSWPVTRSSSSKSLLLETTRLKYDQSILDGASYIKKHIEEKNLLLKNINASNENSKGEIFQKLDYLNRVELFYNEISSLESDIKELEKIETRGDKEMQKMIEDDLESLKHSLIEKKVALVGFLVPEDVENQQSALLELSAGVGGLESRIFCSELFEMYKIYSEKMNWQFDVKKVFTDQTELGEMMRQAQVEVEGQGVFEYLKFESGVHRVQRVPKTEAKGRIHTSTVGVVVIPKPDEINIELNPKDLKIETKTSGGPGGQHANKTESAVRIVHLPSGTVVYNDDERHMMVNRSRAMEELKRKLYQRKYEEQLAKRQMNRKLQIGSSSRSERIRTYNFIQDRITDHRLSENFTGINRFLNAETLPSVIENLKALHQLEIFDEQVENFSKNST